MIELKGIYDVYKVRGVTNGGNTMRKTESDYAAVSTQGKAESGDVIEISAEASFKAQLDATAKQYAVQYDAGVSSERLEALKAKYQNDGCPTSAQATAQAMLCRTSGEGA